VLFRSDLEAKVLRAPDSERFLEDPLRFFRVMAFLGRFEMRADPSLSELCRGMSLDGVARERIEEEFNKLLLKGVRPSLGIRWIESLGKPDVVHWNNGLHDCGHNPARVPVQFPLQDYCANLDSILGRLRALTPRVIWATMTPVHPDRPFRTEQWSWRNAEIDEYNRAALNLMERKQVKINDLYSLVLARVDEYLFTDQLHLSEAGQKVCAEAVAKAVLSLMPSATVGR